MPSRDAVQGFEDQLGRARRRPSPTDDAEGSAAHGANTSESPAPRPGVSLSTARSRRDSIPCPQRFRRRSDRGGPLFARANGLHLGRELSHDPGGCGAGSRTFDQIGRNASVPLHQRLTVIAIHATAPGARLLPVLAVTGRLPASARIDPRRRSIAPGPGIPPPRAAASHRADGICTSFLSR